jgi:ABC-2 type transport system permease protein
MKWGTLGMQSKTSWFNKGMMIQSFRNVGWIGIVYLVGLFFALPLRVLMEWSKQRQYDGFYYDRFENVFAIMFEVQLVLMFAVPILLAIFLFRFLQVKSASDFMHSLPVKRTVIYNQYVGLGVLYLIVPVLITTITLLILDGMLGLEKFFTVQQIISWTGVTIVIILLVFLAGVFVGVVTGLSAVQGVLTFILLLFPAGITGLFIVNLDLFLFGFLPNYYFEYQLMKLSAVTNAAGFFADNKALSLIEIVIYLAVTVGFYGLGMWLYKKRNLETVSQAIVFRQLRPVFKYGVTFCTMLFGGLYFGETQNSLSWAVFGYVIGSLIGYFVAEMLLQKTWRVFTHVKGYLIYAVAMAILGLLIHFDVTGYQQRVPELDEIKAVYFAENSFGYREENDTSNSYVNERPIDTHKPFFNKPENIQAIQNLHEKVIKYKDMLDRPSRSEQSIFIAYELKNGGKVIRQYYLKNVEPFSDYLKQIYNSKEYKEAEYEVLHIDPEEVNQITVSPNGPVDKRAVLADPKAIADGIAALKADVMNETYTPTKKYHEADSSIMILLDDNRYEGIHMQFKQSYTQFESVLKEQEKLKEARITAEDISFAVVVKREDMGNIQELHHGSNESIVQRMLKNKNALKITSKVQIEQSWRNSSWEGAESEYLIGFQFKEYNNNEIRSFNQENVPEFIKQHFE